MKRAWRLSVLSLLLSGCVHAPGRNAKAKVRVVESEGWSILGRGDRLETEQRALADAQKKAVELANGLTVTADTRVDQAIAVRQNIETHADGVIRDYKVIAKREEDGFLKIRIRASVVYHDLAAAAAKQPIIAVMGSDVALVRILRDVLSAAGFRVSDQPAAADIVVEGKSEAYSQPDPRLGRFHSYRARVILDITRSETGEISHETAEASGLDGVEQIARDKAVESAGGSAAAAVVRQLKQRPKTRL